MIYSSEPWIERAACRSIGGEVFFPEVGEDWKGAREICAGRCKVRLQCLDFAMRTELGIAVQSRAGLWGGLSPTQRKKYEPEWLAEQVSAA